MPRREYSDGNGRTTSGSMGGYVGNGGNGGNFGHNGAGKVDMVARANFVALVV